MYYSMSGQDAPILEGTTIMPRPGPRMENTAVRLPDTMTSDLDEIAGALDLTRSEVIRHLLSPAVKRRLRELAKLHDERTESIV